MEDCSVVHGQDGGILERCAGEAEGGALSPLIITADKDPSASGKARNVHCGGGIKADCIPQQANFPPRSAGGSGHDRTPYLQITHGLDTRKASAPVAADIDFGRRVHPDAPPGRPDDDLRFRPASLVAAGLDDTVKIDGDSVGIARRLDLAGGGLDHAAVVDSGAASPGRLDQEFLIGCGLIEHLVGSRQTDGSLASGDRALIVDGVGDEDHIAGLGVDRSQILDARRARTPEGHGVTPHEILVAGIPCGTDEGVHVHHARFGDNDPCRIDEDDSTVGFKSALDHAGGAPQDTIQCHAGASRLNKAGCLSGPDGKSVPIDDQAVGALIDRQDVAVVVQRRAATSHNTPYRVGISLLEDQKATQEEDALPSCIRGKSPTRTSLGESPGAPGRF